MITQAVSLKDIEEIYGNEFAVNQDLNSSIYGKKKLNKDFLDDYIPITVLNNVGPYATVQLRHSNHQKFIIPRDKIQEIELVDVLTRCGDIFDKYFPNAWYYNQDFLYLYYPELELTNSMGLKHTIYDLLVSLIIDPSSGRLDARLTGKRFSYTKEELAVGYIHSHLPAASNGGWGSFCRGGSSPFDKLLLSMNKDNTPKEIELFLIQLGQYLKWESLEGKPHISMKDIGFAVNSDGYSANNLVIDNLTVYSKEILRLLKTSKDLRDTFLKLSGNRLVLDPGQDNSMFYECIEKPLVLKAIELEEGLLDWDERSSKYKQEAGHRELPRVQSDQAVFVTKFNITPRVISTVDQLNPNLVKRFAYEHMDLIIQYVNNLLQYGVYNSK